MTTHPGQTEMLYNGARCDHTELGDISEVSQSRCQAHLRGGWCSSEGSQLQMQMYTSFNQGVNEAPDRGGLGYEAPGLYSLEVPIKDNNPRILN